MTDPIVNPFLKHEKGQLTAVNNKFAEIKVHNGARGTVEAAWGSKPPAEWLQNFDAIFEQQREEWKQELTGSGDDKKFLTAGDIVQKHPKFKEKQRKELGEKLDELFNDPRVPAAVKETKDEILREKKDLDTRKQAALEQHERDKKYNNTVIWMNRQKGKSDDDVPLMMGVQEGVDAEGIQENGKFNAKLFLKEEGLWGNKARQMTETRGGLNPLAWIMECFIPGTTQVRINEKEMDFNPRYIEARLFVLNHVRMSKKYPTNAHGRKTLIVDFELEEKPRRDGWGRLVDVFYNPELQRIKAHVLNAIFNDNNIDPESFSMEKKLEIARQMEGERIKQSMWREAQCGDPQIDISFKIKGKESPYTPTPEDYKYVRERRGELCEFKKDEVVKPTTQSIAMQLEADEKKEIADLSTPPGTKPEAPTPTPTAPTLG